MKKQSLLLLLACGTFAAGAQCDSVNHTGDMIVTSDMFLSGVYNVNGTFQVNPGVTVYVMPNSVDGCGSLSIYAQKIKIYGNINGDFAGYPGGTGGIGGLVVTSLTGDVTALDNCSNKDNTGQVVVQAGQAGTSGIGTGAGLSGATGTNGSGPKQQCLSSSDEAGMIGSAGGAGGGGGGSYGGNGSAGQSGGNGSNAYTITGFNVSTGYVVMGGNGGAGGTQGAVYGTTNGLDIHVGSGGAGSGGGGRSLEPGLAGNSGGAGGAMIKLEAADSLYVTGNISANGENGQVGGNGGHGGQSPKCCSDGCDDCGETTLSCGAGAGSGSGGGSGGGILLVSDNYAKITGALNAKGGNGGFGGTKGTGTSCVYDAGIFCGDDQAIASGDGNDGKRGGAGGGGRVKIFVDACSASDITPVYNVNGGTSFSNGLAGTYYLNCNFLWVNETEPADEGISIYPNPVTSLLNISLSEQWTGNGATIELLNANGQRIQTQEVTGTAHTQFDLSNAQPGLYLVRIIAGERSIIKKITRP